MQIDFIGNRRYLYLISLVVFLGSPLILANRGLNWGLDFAGGSEFRYRFTRDLDEKDIRKITGHEAIKKDAGDAVVQKVLFQGKTEEGRLASEFIIKTPIDLSAVPGFEVRLTQALSEIPDAEVIHLSTNIIGPVVGKYLKMNTLRAVLISVIIILLYMSMRFEFRPGVTATIALFHDTLAVLGAVSLVWSQVDITTVAAILTVLGYSLNDSIVILDRVRENLRLKKKLPFDEMVNLSINQCLTRTIYTSLTTLLTLLTLYIMGPEILQNFAFTLMVGIISGTLSTICIVTPLLVDWYFWDHPEKRPKKKEA